MIAVDLKGRKYFSETITKNGLANGLKLYLGSFPFRQCLMSSHYLSIQ